MDNQKINSEQKSEIQFGINRPTKRESVRLDKKNKLHVILYIQNLTCNEITKLYEKEWERCAMQTL